MIKAVIFDLGGVYFSAGTEMAHKKLVNAFPDLDPKKIYAVIRTGAIAHEYRKGKLTKREFWDKAEEVLGKRFDRGRFSHIWNASYVINKEARQIVRKLRRSYKVAVLTGNIRERVAFLERRYHFKNDFHVFVASYMLGTNKPDPLMYREVSRRLKTPMSQCLFIDSNRSFALAAARCGMKAIYLPDPRLLRKRLSAAGIRV